MSTNGSQDQTPVTNIAGFAVTFSWQPGICLPSWQPGLAENNHSNIWYFCSNLSESPRNLTMLASLSLPANVGPTLTTSSLTISFYLTISSTWASLLFLSPHYLLAHYLLVTIFSSLTISLSSLIISPPASLSPYQASLSPVNFIIIGIPQR
jgi:hypothetical protein